MIAGAIYPSVAKPSLDLTRVALARALFVAIVIAAPLAASADDGTGSVPAKARALAERGRMAHDAGDYAGAITAFTQAYVIAPSPALLFNLAQAYRLQGDCDDAALMYRRYLATNPGPDGRALAENHLASVERCMHKLALHIPVETPNSVASSAIAVDAPQDPSSTARVEKDVGIGLTIGGGAALAIAAYFTVQAHSDEDQVADAYARGMKWKDIAPIDQSGKSAATAAKIFGAGAAVGIAGGIGMYLLGRHTEQTPVITPVARGATVGMSWAF